MSADSELVACHLCGSSVKQSEYDAHVDRCSASNVQCPICFGSFDMTSIERHAASCTGVAPASRGTRSPPPPAAGGGGVKLCRGGCGLYGSDLYGGYCSTCGGKTSYGAEKAYVPGDPPSTKQTYNAGNGRTIVVRKGDLTLEDADVIVNPANKKLDHASGVAGALRRVGGTIVQDSSDIYVAEHGDVPTGTAITAPAGALKCKHLVHTVGPIWSADDFDAQRLAEQQLAAAVIASLVEAEKVAATTIAIPAISSGIFGFPKPLCAKVLFRSVTHYWVENHNSTISQVRFTNNDAETVDVFLKLFPKVESVLIRTLKNEKVLRCARGDQSQYFVGTHLTNFCIVDCTSKANPTMHHAGHELLAEPLNGALDGQLKAMQLRTKAPTPADTIVPPTSFVLFSPQVVVAAISPFDVTEASVESLRVAVRRALLRAAQCVNVTKGGPLGSVAIPALGSKAGFTHTMASQVVLEEALAFLFGESADTVREVILCEDKFSQYFADLLRRAVNDAGEVVALPPIVVPNLRKPASPPENETPAQRRERERALAQARLQLELSGQGPIFD